MPKKMWLRQDAKYFTGQQNSSKLLKADKIPICTPPLPGNGAVFQSHQMIENKHTYPKIRDDRLLQPVFCLILPETAYRKT